MAVGDIATAGTIPLPELLAVFACPTRHTVGDRLKELESDLLSATALARWLDARSAASP